MLNHSNKLSLMKAEPGSQQNPDHEGAKAETNRRGGGGSSPGSDAGSAAATPPVSQSPLHFLADLAEQKSREEKKGLISIFSSEAQVISSAASVIADVISAFPSFPNRKQRNNSAR